jgi:hypothetical protein
MVGDLDAALACPGREVLEVGNDEQRREGPLVAEHHHLGDEGRGGDLVLDRLRGDVLAAGGDEDVLDPVGDAEESLRVDLADVAGVEPPLLVDHLARRLVLVPVPLHDLRPAGEDLAVGVDAQLGAGDGLSHRAELHVSRPVGAEHRRRLGEAVPLEDRETRREEELGDVEGERRPAGDRGLQTPTGALAQLGEDELDPRYVSGTRGHRRPASPPAPAPPLPRPTFFAQSTSFRFTPWRP